MKKVEPCRKAFTNTILALAKQDPSIVVVTSDARGSVTLDEFANTLPDQFVEMGIAEQNEVGFAAGLASCGKRPFVCAPASFLSARSLEQAKVDVAYSKQNVKLFGVSGGVSYGALGASHHSLQDIAVMRAIPGMNVVIPSDRHLTIAMTKALAKDDAGCYIRVGRGATPDVYTESTAEFTLGKANWLKKGHDAALIACGEMVAVALDAANTLEKEGISVSVIDMHTLKPLDEAAIKQAASESGRLFTLEEHSKNGGLGEAVCRIVAESHPVPVRVYGIPDEDVVTGNSAEIFAHYGLTGSRIAEDIRNAVGGN